MIAVRQTIKSFVVDSSYDAVYGGGEHDEPGEFIRVSIAGFCVVDAGSTICGEPVYTDEVMPFEFGELGFELCQETSNFLGVVKRGEDIPEWMLRWIENPFRRKTQEATDGR